MSSSIITGIAGKSRNAKGVSAVTAHSLAYRMLAALMTAILFVTGVAANVKAEETEDLTYAGDFVTRLYINMLGREPDSEGLAFWIDSLVSDRLDGTEVADGFFFSSEFTRISCSISDEEFLNRMYITILGRQPDAQGYDSWLTKLAAGEITRTEIYYHFLDSDEWHRIVSAHDILSGHYQVGQFVDRMYDVVLNRQADSAGRKGWCDALISGTNDAVQMSYGFFFSKEYLEKNKSDEEYVRDLYRALMGREAEPTGLSAWLAVLNRGETRLHVFNGFAVSKEFSAICNSYGIFRGEKVTEPKNITVCIDPGHSSVMPSGTCPLGPGSSITKPADAIGTHGISSGLMEYELTLIISDMLRDELESRGYTVIMTREDSNTAHDLISRATVANEGADIMVRIHADGLDNTRINGCSAICITSANPWNPQTYSDSRRLADCLINSYVAQTGLRRRGVYEQDNMAGNNWSTVPCVLFEMGFMTNPSDDLNMADPAFQARMVTGLANGIDAYFE